LPADSVSSVRGPGWSALVGFLALAAIVSGLGGLVTATSADGWYRTIAKPSFTPPDWVFAPVWTTLYVLMAVAAWLVWRQVGLRHRSIVLYLVQLALNLTWSLIFFGAQAVGVALFEVAFLWAAILGTALAFLQINRVAGLLMLPYLAWVSYALLLNASIWWMNA
jgi:translocator protein